MPRAKPKSTPGEGRPPNRNGPFASSAPVDVMTLTEAALCLRVSEADVLRMAREQGLPSRLIGSEWRFLKAALQHWLSNSPGQSGKEALLAMTGAFEDDPYLEDIVREAYRKRGSRRSIDRAIQDAHRRKQSTCFAMH